MKWFVIILLLISLPAEAQKKQESLPQTKKSLLFPSAKHEIQKRSQALEIFNKIEEGIQTNSVSEYENYFDITVSIAIGANERKYFSTSQAASILSSYFSGRRIVSFEFSSIYETVPAPYATGRFLYIEKGNQESTQIYVSLSYQENRWVISQFNIY